MWTGCKPCPLARESENLKLQRNLGIVVAVRLLATNNSFHKASECRQHRMPPHHKRIHQAALSEEAYLKSLVGKTVQCWYTKQPDADCGTTVKLSECPIPKKGADWRGLVSSLLIVFGAFCCLMCCTPWICPFLKEGWDSTMDADDDEYSKLPLIEGSHRSVSCRFNVLHGDQRFADYSEKELLQTHGDLPDNGFIDYGETFDKYSDVPVGEDSLYPRQLAKMNEYGEGFENYSEPGQAHYQADSLHPRQSTKIVKIEEGFKANGWVAHD